MPHQFGKQKASTAFIVKVHKPRAAVNVWKNKDNWIGKDN